VTSDTGNASSRLCGSPGANIQYVCLQCLQREVGQRTQDFEKIHEQPGIDFLLLFRTSRIHTEERHSPLNSASMKFSYTFLNKAELLQMNQAS